MSCMCISINRGLKTKIRNETEKSIELQIRVGSVMKKAYTVKPGRSKTVDCRNIYKTYGAANAKKGSYPFYNHTCQPYLWIHNPSDYSRLVKQQYISLEDLRDHSEMRICRNPKIGTFAVYKKSRSDLC